MFDHSTVMNCATFYYTVPSLQDGISTSYISARVQTNIHRLASLIMISVYVGETHICSYIFRRGGVPPFLVSKTSPFNASLKLNIVNLTHQLSTLLLNKGAPAAPAPSC